MAGNQLTLSDLVTPATTLGERLSDSQSPTNDEAARTALLKAVPGAIGAHRAHPDNDRAGVDWWVELHGRLVGVDVKIRTMPPTWHGTWPPGDVALETWSVVDRVVGWSRDRSKLCDYVLFLWRPDNQWCLVPFRLLCVAFERNWESWRRRCHTGTQRTRRADGSCYESECVFVPLLDLWAELRNASSSGLSGGAVP